jgi:hypothetical protein
MLPRQDGSGNDGDCVGNNRGHDRRLPGTIGILRTWIGGTAYRLGPGLLDNKSGHRPAAVESTPHD